MPHFDSTITLGNVIATISIVVAMIGSTIRVLASINTRVNALQISIEKHSAIIADHARKLERQENQLVDIMMSVSKIVGRLEAISLKGGI